MTDIAELFARDPLECTDADIMLIIEEYRKRKVNFNAGDLQAGSSKPKKSKAAAPSIPGVQIDLGDLLK